MARSSQGEAKYGSRRRMPSLPGRSRPAALFPTGQFFSALRITRTRAQREEDIVVWSVSPSPNSCNSSYPSGWNHPGRDAGDAQLPCLPPLRDASESIHPSFSYRLSRRVLGGCGHISVSRDRLRRFRLSRPTAFARRTGKVHRPPMVRGDAVHFVPPLIIPGAGLPIVQASAELGASSRAMSMLYRRGATPRRAPRLMCAS
jgi:hypothetical protein